MRMTVATAVACLLGVGISTAHDAHAAIKQDTTIPAQGLGSALKQLANERDIQLVYRSELVGDRATSGAVGELTIDEALTKLLQGTGLAYQYIDDRAITIVPMDSSSSAQASRSTTPTSGYGLWERFRLAQAESPSIPSAPNEDSARRITLEEVVVTAQKREERLQDVPISMSVLGGETLDRSTSRGLQEALKQLPGVSIQDFFLGGGAQVQIRGVGNSQPIFTGTSTTAYYLDAVPFGLPREAIGPDLSAYDMERIEVLRGPQGTLYGASAVNGVVRVLTKDADLNEFELKTRASVSSTERGEESYRGDVAINVPIIEDKLAARLVAGYQDVGGWIDKPNDKNADDAQIKDLRLKVNAQPIDKLAIGLSGWSSRNDRGAPTGDDGAGRNPSLLDEEIATDYDVYGFKATYDFPYFSLTSSTGYLDYNTRWNYDLVLLGIPYEGEISARAFTQEVLLNSNRDGKWRWSVGSLYRDADEEVDVFIPGFYAAPTRYEPVTKSYAVFGELTRVFLNGQWELTGGLRYFEDQASLTETSRFNGAPPSLYVRSADTFRATTPRVALTWHPSDQLTAYASYGEGFRSGIFQHPAILVQSAFPPAKPDLLKNYELGAKASAWDQRLTFDAALYYIDWRDVQQQVSVILIPGTTIGGPAFVNGDSVSGVGVDFGVTVEPVQGLTLAASLNWNDLAMDADVISGESLLYREGQRPDWSPEYTAAASANYAFPIGGSGARGRFSLSANCIAEQTITQLNEAGVREVLSSDRLLIAGSSFALDFRDAWSASIFVDNLTNERGISSPNPIISSPRLDTRVRPRTVGLQVEYRFD